jgi:C-terminal processing protease CtpA/Prc
MMQSRISMTLVGVLFVALLLCGAALAWGARKLQRLQEENRVLQEQANELPGLRAHLQELERLRVQADELERLRKQTQEIHLLRAQYQEAQRLREQYAVLQQENDRLKLTHQQLSAQYETLRSQVQSLVAARPAVPGAPPAAAPASWLGVSIQSLADLPELKGQVTGISDGVVVSMVIPNSPAEASGLKAGDIVTAIDGKAVTTAQQLRDEMRGKQTGQRVVLDVYRNGLVHKLGVNAAPFPTRE